MGVEGLLTATPPGPSRKLAEAQRSELTALVEAGPLAAGYPSGAWTGPMVGDLIEEAVEQGAVGLAVEALDVEEPAIASRASTARRRVQYGWRSSGAAARKRASPASRLDPVQPRRP
jgi:hypothetical protein